MADIYQITTPNGTTYNLKDKWARDEIASIESAIAGGVTFIGQTTTPLTDGCTTSPIVVNGENVTPIKGYLVVTQQYDVQAESTAYQTVNINYTAGQTITYYTGTAINNSAVSLTGQETATVTQSGAWIFPNAPDTYYAYYSSVPCKVVRTAATLPDTGWDLTYYRLNVVQLPGYGKEFIYDGTKWIEMGDLNALGDMAWVDMASADYTPAGTVSQPTFTGNSLTSTGTVAVNKYSLSVNNGSSGVQYATGAVSTKTFTGTEATIKPKVTAAGTVAISTGTGTANYTPAGTVSQPTFSGSSLTSTGSFTPAGSVSVSTNATTNKTATVSAASSGTATYTPAGTVSAPVITKNQAGSTTTVNSITAVGTLPTLTTSVTNENLTISFSQGTLPTKGSDVTVKTGDATYTADAPTFSGTAVRLVTGNIAVPSTYTASFTGTEGSVSVSGTPAGTVSQPTFSGTGTQLKATFTGSEVEGTATYTPEGSIDVVLSKLGLTLSGSTEDKSVSVTGTPTGTVSRPTFSGTEATITVTP